jgi:polysaccharide export outer membrane protein
MKKLIRYYRIEMLLIGSILMIASCVTVKKTSYLQEYADSPYPDEPAVPETYIIQPNDNLFIRVTTPDPQWSAMFNTVAAGSTTVGHSEVSVDLLSYTVNEDGTVEIPYLGAIPVVGKTLKETRILLETALADYVTDAAITVKLVNRFVSVLGEVNRPGRYPIYQDQMNVFQALAMAGDMATYSNRYEVSIIRQTTKGSIVKEFDLTDRKLIDSEFYFVKPNDVIYAKPMKGKFFAMNQFPYAVILSTVTTFLLILNFIQPLAQ